MPTQDAQMLALRVRGNDKRLAQALLVLHECWEDDGAPASSFASIVQDLPSRQNPVNNTPLSCIHCHVLCTMQAARRTSRCVLTG
eukprot:1619533-Rhodomonas_salina.2